MSKQKEVTFEFNFSSWLPRKKEKMQEYISRTAMDYILIMKDAIIPFAVGILTVIHSTWWFLVLVLLILVRFEVTQSNKKQKP